MLTDSAVKGAKAKAKAYHLTDRQGMSLLIKPNGGKYRRMGYSLHGKRNKYATGVYPSVSLCEARAERDKAKRLITQGIDPIQHRQLTKASQRKSFENSFEAVVLKWLAKQKQVWTEGHSQTVEGRLWLNLLPWLARKTDDF